MTTILLITREKRRRNLLEKLLNSDYIIIVAHKEEKISLLSENFANITVGKETKRAKILSVIENYANPHLTRQNVITKGCIIETELGKARVTSRPGQHGIINAVLLGEK